jgi:lipooligosaccharide transport system ATP-binding protein
MTGEVVTARDLTKDYPGSGAPAVAGIDLSIGAEECFGFLGPNGAGKTTTMRMISCRVQRTSGELMVLGIDPATDERAIKSRMGVVPQETNLDTVLSVGENLLTYARYFGLSDPEARTKVAELLDFVALGDRAEWHVEALSGGMKRRLLIARALVNDPELLVLDEPTTGLDPQARHLVWEKLRDLKRRGVTLIITTHYMDEAAQLCDRLVIMHQGSILVQGRPLELIRGHVAPDVVELTTTSDHDELLARLVGGIIDHESAADRMILYTDDGETLLKAINESGVSYEAAILRRATLEDVFLKLTGRRLEE